VPINLSFFTDFELYFFFYISTDFIEKKKYVEREPSKRARVHSHLQIRGRYRRLVEKVPGRSLGEKILNWPSDFRVSHSLRLCGEFIVNG
jgi:hypothetical protein